METHFLIRRGLPILGLFLMISCQRQTPQTNAKGQDDVQAFLHKYTEDYLKLYYVSAEAEWAVNTKIVDGDTTNAHNAQVASEALAEFSGSEENIKNARSFLENKDQLEPVQVKQLEAILYNAANNPAIVPELVSARIAAETAQSEALYGYDFMLNGASVTTNELDKILRESADLNERMEAWSASKEVGKELKSGLTSLQSLRNKTVQALGYNDYFTYQVSDYGMSVDEMLDVCRGMIRDVWPLYRELHTYARYNLAEKYGKDVPEMLPAHWLPNRWGQDWTALVEVEGIDLDGILEEKGDKWQVEQAERFYVSMGFDPLPQVFWDKSSLYPVPAEADYKKNNHASAWHLNLQNDVRCLMSVVPNSYWYETTHHELGHIYYYIAYSNPDVPPLLRGGANRAYHEAIGSQLGLAAMQKPFLAELDLIPADLETDETQKLLQEALNYVVLLPWGAGVMTFFEHDLYKKNLAPEEYNNRWWELKREFQGIAPPNNRGNEYCDPATKTHINNDAAQYYDYALSYVLLFQFHNYIAENILNQDPRATNYYGSKEVGQFLQSILEKGATEDWRTLLRETTGEDLNATAMLNYFEPLMAYLREVNQGRAHTLPETI